LKKVSSWSFVMIAGLLILADASALRADWQLNGIPVCADGGYQEGAQITGDGVGGAIIAWVDYRDGRPEVYTQRVNDTGNVLWATDGVAVSSGDSVSAWFSPVFGLISDGQGGVIVAWIGHRNGNPDIFAQRIDGDGNPLWGTDGVSVCKDDSAQTQPRIVSDANGGAIIAWTDRRGDGNESGIYAQRIDADGAPIWVMDGVAVCSVAGDYSYWVRPEVASDGAGGAIVIWQWEGVYAQRIDESGVAQWSLDGVLTSATGGSSKLASDDTGGAIIAWLIWGDFEFDVYTQRLDGDGVAQWGPSGVMIGAGESDSAQPLDVMSDGQGGAVAAWGDFSAQIYVQRVGEDGNTIWTPGGINLRNPADPHSQWEPKLAPDGTGGVIVSWFEYIGGSYNHDIYVQRIDEGGDVKWGEGGVEMCVLPSDQRDSRICADGTGGAIVVWGDERSGNADVYAMRVNSVGRVPTLLRDFFAEVIENTISVKWTLSDIDRDARFIVLRTETRSGRYAELQTVEITRQDFSFEFVDEDCELGMTYRYRVDVEDGVERLTLFETGPLSVGKPAVALRQNVPNPFNPTTSISFVLPERTRAVLAIYDVEGRHVRTVVDEVLNGGVNEATWDGRDAQGSRVSSGVYLYRLEVGKQTITKKLTILK
jgi:hypothetical protein